MAVHRIKKGLDLPITGLPSSVLESARPVTTVAALATDVVGLKPRMHVKEGDVVKRGQPLFEHRKRPGLIVTAPGAGTVKAIHRGERRALHSVVLELSEREREGASDLSEQVELTAPTQKAAASLSRDQVKALLIESGLWAALRERPFSTVPSPTAAAPGALFVNATDSNPGAPDPEKICEGAGDALSEGLLALSKLTDGPTFFCKPLGAKIDVGSAAKAVRVEEFTGRHPYGLVGLHMHRLWPVNRERVAWHLGVQDAIALGKLLTTGVIDPTVVVSLTGPQVKSPRMLRTRWGANLEELVAGELLEGENRIISGSVFGGRAAKGEVFGYLGRYHQQISVLREGRDREFLGWALPGFGKYSLIPTFVSKFIPGNRRYAFTTDTNGSRRAMVPIGMYEKVMPMDIMPTFLLRALAMGDIERAEKLGCLELDEEDLALCTFVCPSKNEYGPMLRSVLTKIQEEG